MAAIISAARLEERLADTRQELVLHGLDTYATVYLNGVEVFRNNMPNGTFKIAVIAQQIYARYVRGSTEDERFAGFGHFVAALGRIALQAIEKRKI